MSFIFAQPQENHINNTARTPERRYKGQTLNKGLVGKIVGMGVSITEEHKERQKNCRL